MGKHHRHFPLFAPCCISILLFAWALPARSNDDGSDRFLGRSVDEWSVKATSGSQTQRVQAAWALAQLCGRSGGTPQDAVHFSELVKLISDTDPAIRYWGVQGLLRYAHSLKDKDGGRAAVRNTLLPLLEDESPAARIAAAEAIGRLGDTDRALQVLVATLAHPQDSVRIQAVSAIEALGLAARPASGTLQSATRDRNEYVKRISQRALEMLNRSEHD